MENDPIQIRLQADADRIIALDVYGERPGEIVNEISSILASYSDEKARIEVAKHVAFRHGRRVSEYFDLFQVTDETAKFQIAQIAAADHARRTSWHFQMYAIQDESARYKVAETAALSNGLGVSEFIGNYELTDVRFRISVLRRALLNDTASLEYVHMYFPEYDINPIKANPEVQDVVDWLRDELQPKLPEFIPPSVVSIYDDMKRRDGGIKLLAGYMSVREGEEQTIPNNPRDALELLTGFPATKLGEKGYSSNSLGDLYELLTDLQSKYSDGCFRNIRLNDELLRPSNIHFVLDFVNNFNLISQLLGDLADESYQQLIEDMICVLDTNEKIEGLNGLQLNLTSSNILKLNVYLKERLINQFNNMNLDNDFQLTPERLDILTEKWADISVILSLAARYSGRKRWNSELPVLSYIIERVLTDTFLEYKYQGKPEDIVDREAVKKQIGFLSDDQLTNWRKNPSNILVTDTRVNDERVSGLESRAIIDKISSVLLGEPIELSDDFLIELGSGFAAGDKQLQRILKGKFGTDSTSMLKACLHYMSSLSSNDDLMRAITRIKSLKDLFKFRQEIRTELDNLSKSLHTQRGISKRIVFTTLFDDPKLLMSIGRLVRASSCLNYNNGSEAPAILAGVIDANIKGIAAFVIGPGEGMDSRRFQLLVTDLHQYQSSEVQTEFIAAKKILVVTTPKSQYAIELGNALHRRYVKVGKTYNGEAGVKMERSSTQTHVLSEIVEEQIQTTFYSFASNMNADTTSLIQIPTSRNPGGSYSDTAIGHQSGSYIM